MCFSVLGELDNEIKCLRTLGCAYPSLPFREIGLNVPSSAFFFIYQAPVENEIKEDYDDCSRGHSIQQTYMRSNEENTIIKDGDRENGDRGKSRVIYLELIITSTIPSVLTFPDLLQCTS